MLGWLFGDGWQDEPLIERKVRKRRRGPSWQAFWLGVTAALIIGIALGVMLQESQLHHAGLW